MQCRRPGFDPWVGKIPCVRKWQPTPVFFPEESHGQRRLAGYSPWASKESDTTEQLTLSLSPFQSFTYFTNLTFLISFISLITRKNLSQSLSPQEWAHQPFHEHCQFSSVAQSCLTLCDPMDHSMPGFPIHRQLPELIQTYVHRIDEAIHPSHPLSSPSPPTFNLFQYQGLFK